MRLPRTAQASPTSRTAHVPHRQSCLHVHRTFPKDTTVWTHTACIPDIAVVTYTLRIPQTLSVLTHIVSMRETTVSGTLHITHRHSRVLSGTWHETEADNTQARDKSLIASASSAAEAFPVPPPPAQEPPRAASAVVEQLWQLAVKPAYAVLAGLLPWSQHRMHVSGDL